MLGLLYGNTLGKRDYAKAPSRSFLLEEGGDENADEFFFYLLKGDERHGEGVLGWKNQKREGFRGNANF